MEEWNKLLRKYPEANFLQSPEWGNANGLMGNTSVMAVIEKNGLALMIKKDAKRGRYLEVPGGPLIDWQDPQMVKSAKKQMLETANAFHCTFIRFRPQLKNTPENLKILSDMGAKPAPMHLAAEHTVIIDLTKSEDELLKNMRRQTRYEVKRSQKLDIKVEKSNSEEIFREFHKVQAETAKLQNFIPPNLNTLLAEREAFGNKIAIYTAKTGKNTELKGQKFDPNLPIAYGLIFWKNKEAEYYEAASTSLHRTLPGAYALEWQVIKDLKAQGIERYNLWGIAPKGAKNHRYAGVTTFKTGFGGEIVEFVPAHDIIIDKVKYLKNLVIETARKKRRHL